MGIYTSIKTDRAIRKLARARIAYDKAAVKTIEDLAKIGKWYAKSIAPVASGYTYNMIDTVGGKDSKGPFRRVRAKNPTRGGNNRKYGPGNYPNFNLVRWMHLTRGRFQTDNPMGRAGTKHITSGDPQFMYTTRNYLNRIKTRTATGRFKGINIR